MFVLKYIVTTPQCLSQSLLFMFSQNPHDSCTLCHINKERKKQIMLLERLKNSSMLPRNFACMDLLSSDYWDWVWG